MQTGSYESAHRVLHFQRLSQFIITVAAVHRAAELTPANYLIGQAHFCAGSPPYHISSSQLLHFTLYPSINPPTTTTTTTTTSSTTTTTTYTSQWPARDKTRLAPPVVERPLLVAEFQLSPWPPNLLARVCLHLLRRSAATRQAVSYHSHLSRLYTDRVQLWRSERSGGTRGQLNCSSSSYPSPASAVRFPQKSVATAGIFASRPQHSMLFRKLLRLFSSATLKVCIPDF